MLYSTANYKAVTCTHIELPAGAANLEVARYYIDNLIMRMTVCSADPPFFHAMLGGKQLALVSADTTGQAWLGAACFGFRTSYDN